ncbi:eukaryotic translation initiation factor 4 gamma 3-like [Sipha flava]|uniref:Eukaryotic translation initiation factor 4 gamma 3-like n=2 Tax=Sipha flava TaxID=143950 RepID=A0A8B8GMH7_9HEMI|nr:eukaryotic translation initiation factor 4 gamma 3-like [Sipha flava]
MAYRKRSVGNCRYMCELYKVGILMSQTLETSIKYLLKTPNEETLECACNILKHTGKTISHKTTFNKLHEYMSAKYKNTISMRIRFMIQDTIELKDNDWVPRNIRPKQEVCNPKISSKPEKLSAPALNVLSTKNTPRKLNDQIKIKPSKEIQKVVVIQNDELANATEISGPKQSLLPSSDVENNNKSLELPCIGLLPESIEECHSPNTEDIEIEEMQKKYRSIIDNITAENIVPMAKKMISLPIKTDGCLKNVVELLFQKAMDKPELIPQYAHICSLMKDMVVHSKDRKFITSFRTQLITVCQNEFEAMFNRKQMITKDRIEIESCKNKKMRKILQSSYDQKELDHRSRAIANCRLICELLKVNVLVPPVLEMCVAKLAESSKETSIE